MTPDMYFLPMIDSALRKPDPEQSLKEAFEEIERLGKTYKYQRGFKQFLVFMTEANRQIDDSLMREVELISLVDDLKLQIISGALEDLEERQAWP